MAKLKNEEENRMKKKRLLWLQGINEKIEKADSKWEFVAVVILAVLIVMGVTIGMGTMTSGFHLVDDHEFVEWEYQMKYEGDSILDMIKEKVLGDFVWRYEPLYYTTRMLSCYLFGINLPAYSILKALEIIISCICLYYCGKEMGASRIYSFLFAMVSLVGYQSAVWWKLGPQEAQCTMLFSAGYYCMLRYLKGKKKTFMVGSILLFAMMVNYKESFILLMPFLMLYVLYYELMQEGGRITWQTIIRGIKAHLAYLIILGCIFLIPVIVIVTYVGTNNYGSVGLEAGVPIDVYVEAITRSLQGDLKWFKRFGILFCLILLTYWDELKKLWKEMLLTVTFLLPQFVIFGRSGMGERYILPSAIGFAYFFIIVIPKWKPLKNKRRVIYVFGILLLLAAHGRVMLREADYFRHRGESVTAMLEAVNQMAKEDTNVLACFRPNEEGNLTINYWLKLHDFDNVYYWTEEDRIINKECDINLQWPEDYYEEQSFEDMDIVVVYNNEDRHWVYDMSLDLSDFQEIPCGTLTMYVRNGSVDQIIEPEVEGLRIHF